MIKQWGACQGNQAFASARSAAGGRRCRHRNDPGFPPSCLSDGWPDLHPASPPLPPPAGGWTVYPAWAPQIWSQEWLQRPLPGNQTRARQLLIPWSACARMINSLSVDLMSGSIGQAMEDNSRFRISLMSAFLAALGFISAADPGVWIASIPSGTCQVRLQRHPHEDRHWHHKSVPPDLQEWCL